MLQDLLPEVAPPILAAEYGRSRLQVPESFSKHSQALPAHLRAEAPPQATRNPQVSETTPRIHSFIHCSLIHHSFNNH